MGRGVRSREAEEEENVRLWELQVQFLLPRGVAELPGALRGEIFNAAPWVEGEKEEKEEEEEGEVEK